MALIKCPECSKEVSTEAKICPHCGYPLEKDEEIKPKDNSWVYMWRKKIKNMRIIISCIFTISLLLTILFICLTKFDQNVVVTKFLDQTFTDYYEKTAYVVLSWVFGSISFVSFLYRSF